MQSASQRQMGRDILLSCHSQMKVADQTSCLSQSQYADTRQTSPSVDHVMPDAWQGSHYSYVTGKARLVKSGFEPPISRYVGRRHTNRPPRRFFLLLLLPLLLLPLLLLPLLPLLLLLLFFFFFSSSSFCFCFFSFSFSFFFFSFFSFFFFLFCVPSYISGIHHSSSAFLAISLGFTILLLLLLLCSQLYLWGSPFFFCVPSYISGIHHSSSSAFPALSLGFTILLLLLCSQLYL